MMISSWGGGARTIGLSVNGLIKNGIVISDIINLNCKQLIWQTHRPKSAQISNYFLNWDVKNYS